MTKMLSAILASLALGTAAVYAFDNNAARSRSVYQVVTDRFALSDGSSPACSAPDRKYCGGSWKGLQNKLDYIQGMGFDTVWISPIVSNIGGSTGYGEAYHGYWTLDITKLNSKFGTEQDLKDLISALHSRNMYIMVDIVVNHVAATSGSTFQASESYGPFNSTTDSYHPFCWITDYTNQTQVEECWLGDETVALPDLNTESDYVVSEFKSWLKNLVSNYSIDSLRIDTVKHIRQDFWPSFIAEGGVFAVGEVLDGGAKYVAGYQNNSMDSVFNYPVYFPLVRAFNGTSGDMAGLASAISLNKQEFKDTTLLGNFLDNHDNARFENYTSDAALIMNAAAFPFVTDGVPYVYYGQEQGFKGGNDPDNREPLWTTGYSTSTPMYAFFNKLNSIRTAAGNASSTYHTNQATVVANTSTEIVISKAPLLTVLSNRGANSGNHSVSISNAGYGNSVQLLDLVSCSSVTTDSNGGLSANVADGEPVIYIPADKKGSLCPQTTTSPSGSSSAAGLTIGLPAMSSFALVVAAALSVAA